MQRDRVRNLRNCIPFQIVVVLFEDCGDILPPQPSISAALKPESAQDVGHKLHTIPRERTHTRFTVILPCDSSRSSIMGKEASTRDASFA